MTPDEFDYPWGLELIVKVNGEERQRAQVSDLVFDVPALVAIATGTPGGVGEAMKPKRYLTSGDVVEVTVTSVGSIRNRFAASEEAK